MFIRSLKVEWSFCECTNASFFPLLSSLAGFDKLICVRAYTPSPVSPTVQTPSSLTQFLSYHRSEKTCLSTALCAPLPLQPSDRTPNLGPDPEHPRPPRGVSGVHPVSLQGVCPVVVHGRASQRGLLIFLLYLYILFVGFLLLIEGTAWLSWWHPGHKACCELSQRVISLCSWPHRPVCRP